MLRYHGGAMMRIGYMPISDHVLAMVAHSLYQGRNTSVRMQRFLSWDILSRALESGRVDAAFIMAPLAMRLLSKGVELLYVMDGHHDGSSLSVSACGSLGKTLALPNRHSTHQALLDPLTEAMPRVLGEVATAYVNPSYVIRSLKQQEIDSFFCAEPWSTKSVHEGVGEILVRSKDIMPGHLCCILAVRKDFAQAHGAQVRDYIKQLLKARDHLKASPRAAAEVQAHYTGIAPDIAQHVLEQEIITFDELKPDPGRTQDFTRLVDKNEESDPKHQLKDFICTDFF